MTPVDSAGWWLSAREALRIDGPSDGSAGGVAPVVVVTIAVVFNLWVLRAETSPVSYPNDMAVHRSMVEWAGDRIASGHLPLDGWYPDLALGSSRFHHYQSLPHVLTASVGRLLGPDRAIAWSLYLLLSLWPFAVYAGGRLLGWERWPSALAGLLSPLIVSASGLGYEYGSYIWRGYGTWTQLWGAWMLPLAWGCGWRAVDRGRGYAVAAGVLALTVAVHLLTGYLALLSLGVFVLVRPGELLRRLGRAAVVGFGSLLVAGWVVVPLLADRAWTIQDEFSRGRVFYDSFGALRILGWFATGALFDRWRAPVLTILVVVGVVICAWRSRREPRARALLGVGLLSLVLFFGRPTLGPVLRLLPGSGDLFLRRFVFGVHLAGLYLGGIALVRLGTVAWGLVLRAVRRWRPAPVPAAAAALVGALALALLLAPAWTERAAFAATSARWIHDQAAADATDGADVAGLVDFARHMGTGRIYAGMRSNWGPTYRVGQVPMFAMLLANRAEGVGFTRPTWSLSSPVEFRFDERNAEHYDLFDVRYVILPSGREPPVPATEVTRAGRHVLWRLDIDGPMELVDVLPAIPADRTDLGRKMAPWLSSDLPAEGRFPSVAFAGHPGAPPTLGEGPRGTIRDLTVDLEEGRAAATVTTDRPVMLVLKASFDPRWQVTVDGGPAEPQMIAPSFVGRTVPAGEHTVVFTYEPFPRYDVLLLLGAATLAALAFGPGWLEGRRRRRLEQAAS